MRQTSSEDKDRYRVKIRDMSFYREDSRILSHIDLDVRQGQIIGIMGPSGCGKTTLLRLIGGQLKPHSGSIEVNGHAISDLSRKKRYQARRQMGMLFQQGALFTHLSVYDNVAFPLREHTSLSEAMIRSIVLMKLEAVGLRGARHKMPGELSGGMARRVALARTIALDPELLLYDEPFTGQDPISMGVLVRLIKEINDALGLTSILVSHDVPETLSIADYIYVLGEGRIVGEGTPEAIKNHDNPYVKQFIHGLADGVLPFHYPGPPYEEDLFEGAFS